MAEHDPILDQARKQKTAEVSTTAVPAVPGSGTLSSSKLEAVEAGLAASTTRITQSIKELEATASQTKTQTEAATGAINAAMRASQTIKSAERVADLEAQLSTLEVFDAAMGLQTQVALSDELARDQKRVGDLLDEKIDIVDDVHTGIGLIDQIINDFRSIQVNAEINAATNKQNQTVREITNIGAATESFARTNALTKQTLTEGSIKAEQDLIVANATLAVSQQELKNINSNSDSMIRLLNADQRSVSNLLQLWRSEGEQENRELAKERNKLAKEQMALTREKMLIELPAAKVAFARAELALVQAQKLGPTQILIAEQNLAKITKAFNDQVATEDTVVSAVQKGQEAITKGSSESREIILFGFNSRSADTVKKYIRLQEIGGVDEPKLGNTPADARENISIVAPEGNVTRTTAIAFLDVVTAAQVEKYNKIIAAGGKLPKDIEVIKQDFNTIAFEKAAKAAEEIREGDTTNLYQAPPMSVLEQKAAVKNSVFYKKVIAPIGMKEFSPQRIIDAAVAGIVALTVSPEEAAAGIEAIFDAAAAHNNTDAGGFRRVGLPNQTTYNTAIKLPITVFDELSAAKRVVVSAAKGTVLPIAKLGTIFTILTKGLPGVIEDRTVGFTPIANTTVVDLMDTAKIKETLVKLLSSQPPTPPFEESTNDTSHNSDHANEGEK